MHRAPVAPLALALLTRGPGSRPGTGLTAACVEVTPATIEGREGQ